MEINSYSSSFDLSSISRLANSSSTSSSSTSSSSSSQSTTELSNIGQLMSQFSSMSTEEKQEADDFRDTVLAAMESGDFDAAALAEEAPESLVALAEETGMDLEELVNEIASGTPPPPPPGGEQGGMGMSGFSEEEMAAAEDYRQSLIDAMESGEFDAETLAESAPDAVVAMAEEAGMSVEDFITQVAEGDDQQGNMPPSPPPANSNASNGLSMYSDVASYGTSSTTTSAQLLSQLLNS